MPAISTSENDIKEQLSLAYLQAVAARAGCQVTPWKLDRMSVDATLAPVHGAKVKLDVQLKATAHLELTGDEALFDLPIKNYEDLRSTEVENAQILIVFCLPNELNESLFVDEQALIMRRCAYWASLYNQPATQNTTSVRVRLPRAQLFTPEALRELMDRRLTSLRGGSGGL